jgi:hypothetical protein
MVAVKEVAQEFALDEQELIRQSLRAFLLERLRLLDAERRANSMSLRSRRWTTCSKLDRWKRKTFWRTCRTWII